MKEKNEHLIGRRELLARTAPACAMACMGLGSIPELAADLTEAPEQEQHKFDLPLDPPPPPLTNRMLVRMQEGKFIRFVQALRNEMEEPELIRVLNAYTEEIGRRTGEGQIQRRPDNSFKTFVDQFRPPRYANSLTHEIVEDTDTTFQIKVTECVWASVFREAGLEGDIGHAAHCNMDYAWPTAFNPAIRMERTKTLMQGHDCCNHRYVLIDKDEEER